MRTAIWTAGLVLLAACDGLSGARDPAAVYVRVVDHRGNLLRPDRVVWYYPPDRGRYDGEHEAECIAGGCSVFAVPVEAEGAAYVSASRARPYPGDPLCTYFGYDAKPVEASPADPPTVVLRLDMRTLACQ